MQASFLKIAQLNRVENRLPSKLVQGRAQGKHFAKFLNLPAVERKSLFVTNAINEDKVILSEQSRWKSRDEAA